MKQTKGAIGNLLNRYKAVLKKCHLLNTFGSLAVAGMLVMGGASYANAESIVSDGDIITTTTIAPRDDQGELSWEDITAGGDIIAFDASKPVDHQGFDIAGGNITATGVIKGGEITAHGNLTADHVETFRNDDNTLTNNAGSVFVEGAVNLPGDSTTQRRFDFVNTEGSHNVLGNVTTGACISIQGDGEHKSTLTAGVLAVGGGSFTLADGMQADIEAITFNIDGRKARIHGDNPNSATILDVDTFVMHNGHLIAESHWDSQYAMGAVRNLSPDETRPGVLIGDGHIAVGSNTILGLGEGATLDWLYGQVRTYTGYETPTENGVKSVLALTQPLEVQDGFKVLVDGDLNSKDNLNLPSANTGADNTSPLVQAIATSGTFTQGDNTLLIVNATSASNAAGAISYVAADAAALGTAKVGAGAKLAITGAQTGETYTILGDGFDPDQIQFVKNEAGVATGWQGENLLTDNPLVSLNRGEDGTFSGKAVAAASVLPGLEGELAATIDAANVDHLIGTGDQFFNGGQKGTQFLSRALRLAADAPFGYGAAGDATTTIESAARIAFAGAVPQMTKMASDAATNAVVNRLGFANPENGAKSMNVDGKLVDDKALGLALWIAPLWSNQTGFGMEAGNLDYGYNANLGGVSIGADYTWANNIRAGLMFNIGGGYAQSNGGDLNDTTNSMTFWGVGAYGGWEYNNFAVMADVSYTSTWNSVEQDVDSRMGMSDLEADIQTSAISAGLRFEYKLETQYLDLIPHVGARYMSINTWGYDVETNGGTVLEGDGFQQNIWTFPVGITFSKELEMNNSWYFKPSVDFTVIPAAGDIKAKEDIRFTGLPYSTEMETQMMDYFTWQGGVGIEFGNDNMSVGVNYTLQAGQNSTGHGVFGMFRYEF